jgi:hypothetical protein
MIQGERMTWVAKSFPSGKLGDVTAQIAGAARRPVSQENRIKKSDRRPKGGNLLFWIMAAEALFIFIFVIDIKRSFSEKH